MMRNKGTLSAGPGQGKGTATVGERPKHFLIGTHESGDAVAFLLHWLLSIKNLIKVVLLHGQAGYLAGWLPDRLLPPTNSINAGAIKCRYLLQLLADDSIRSSSAT